MDEEIEINKASYKTKIPMNILEHWIKEGLILVREANNGKYISLIDLEQRVLESEIAHDAFLQGLWYSELERVNDHEQGKDIVFVEKSNSLIEASLEEITTIENIHRKMHKHFDVLREESAKVAAYIIYAKVIRILKMIFICLKARIWDSLVLWRTLTEATTLTQYFIITESNEESDLELKRWFRMNECPEPYRVRKALSANIGENDFSSALEEIYSNESKPLHISINDILETYRFEPRCNDAEKRIIPHGFDYEGASFPRKYHGIVLHSERKFLMACNIFSECFKDGDYFDQDDLLSLIKILHRLNEVTGIKQNFTPELL